ncbi:MAG: adaptor protein MecA [Clostridia bacterium]|nr:adaptor protein MecA [Clostridia bacterium]
MKFLNISDIKLKVTLSPEDCRDYGIDTAKGEISTREVRRAVRVIIERAREECGFSVGSDRILVQTYPLPSGECELLITRLSAVPHRERAVLTSSDGMSTMEHRRGVYRFSSIDDLRSAVRAAYREDAECDLYLDDLGRYYLHVSEHVTDGLSEFEIFIEYGERLAALPIAVLSEYGTHLAGPHAFEYVMHDEI